MVLFSSFPKLIALIISSILFTCRFMSFLKIPLSSSHYSIIRAKVIVCVQYAVFNQKPKWFVKRNSKLIFASFVSSFAWLYNSNTYSRPFMICWKMNNLVQFSLLWRWLSDNHRF
jgi:hypothetical protein